jgi:hypothetical protein
MKESYGEDTSGVTPALSHAPSIARLGAKRWQGYVQARY